MRCVKDADFAPSHPALSERMGCLKWTISRYAE